MIVENVKTNVVPSLTWNWLKSNNDLLSVEGEFYDFYENNGNIEELQNGFSVKSLCDVAFPYEKFEDLSGVFNRANPKPFDSGFVANSKQQKTEPFTSAETKSYDSNASIDSTDSDAVSRFVACPENGDENNAKSQKHKEVHPLEKIIKDNAKNQKVIMIEGDVKNPLIINFNFSGNIEGKENCKALNNYKIIAKKDSRATVIFVFKGNDDCVLVKNDIFIEENAELKIIKVQLMENKSLLLDDTAIFQEKSSKVDFVQIELGAVHVDSGLHVVLKGDYSKFVSNIAYLCRDEQYLDMNHIVEQYGKKTECKMFVNGSVKDSAKKTYRGTIDLKKGCCGSKGNEMEETLLLSPKAVNKSLPVILCDEEDVEGEHGATIGRLSAEMLFYMQTRSISQKMAEELLSKAKVQAAADLIENESVKDEVVNFMNDIFGK